VRKKDKRILEYLRKQSEAKAEKMAQEMAAKAKADEEKYEWEGRCVDWGCVDVGF